MIANYFRNKRINKIALTYGENFPDGLCAGPLAYWVGASLVLCADNNFVAAKEYVNENEVTDGYVTGGTQVLPDETVQWIFGCNTFKFQK